MKINGVEVHESITQKRAFEATGRWMHSLDNPGFCIACGHEVEGVEPDARGYECEICEEPYVYGAAELSMILEAAP